MIKKIHFVLGLVLTGIYVHIFSNVETYLPGLWLVMGFNMNRVAIGGTMRCVVITILLPLIPITCFLIPGYLTKILSPRTSILGAPLLTNGFWYVVGYFFLMIAIAVMALFSG